MKIYAERIQSKFEDAEKNLEKTMEINKKLEDV
jgi:hypothetical protein